MSGRGPGGRRKGQKGQALVIFGLLFVFLIGIAGLATDGAVAYAYSVSLERAASSAALAGAPYMPGVFATAQTRALDEAKKNGWVNGAASPAGAAWGTTAVVVSASGTRQLDVKVSTFVPTFFMAALGIRPYLLTREAVAGYLPPIPLGQPGNQLGSTGAQLGGGNNFYLLRFKGENKYRSEGDPYTPQPFEPANGPAKDVHTISQSQGAETTNPLFTSLDCSTGTPGWRVPCKGGQNYRITIPPGATGELQVYNAAFAPDFNSNNSCDNIQGLPLTFGGNATCSTLGYTMREGTDDGMGGNDPNASLGEPLNAAHCGKTIGVDCTSGAGPTGNRARRRLYNATAYTVLAVPNIFLRSDDKPIMQTRVLPIDATAYDGDKGDTGHPSGATPTYVNVNNGKGYDITQTYGVTYANPPGLCAVCPQNMRVYHSWDNIVTEDGTTNGDNRDSGGPTRVNIVSQVKDATNYGAYVSGGVLKEGTYRLRVDALNSDGQCCSTPPEGDASKAYALRIVKPGTAPYMPSAGNECVGSGGVKCDVAGWEDMTLYSPIAGVGGTIPLFNLPSEYQGQTIQVDAFDVGDASGNVNLSLIDPKTNLIATCGAGSVALPAAVAGPAPIPAASCQQYSNPLGAAALLNIYNQGHSRFVGPFQHVGPQNPSGQAPGSPDNRISHLPFTPVQAGEQSTLGGTRIFNGQWIRFEIPIDPTYDGNCPLSPTGGCYWQLKYELTAGASDTFSFAVSTKGGPLHLLSS